MDRALRIIADFGVVRDEHDGDALLCIETLEHLEDFHRRDGIEVAGGFIGKQDIRTVDEGAGDGDALLLAARELRRGVVQAPLQGCRARSRPSARESRAPRWYSSGISTFCSADVRASRLKLWKTNPMRAERTSARSSSDSRETSRPSNRYVPEVGVSRKPRMFISVDLPEPDAPIRATMSPFSTRSDTPLRTGTSIPPGR